MFYFWFKKQGFYDFIFRFYKWNVHILMYKLWDCCFVKVFVIGVVNAKHNEPFFMSPVHETVKHYLTQFDTLNGIMPRDLKERIDFEREVHGRSILNVIACEGVERVERPEFYKQWHNRIKHSGFKQIPLQSSSWYTSIKSILKCYNNFLTLSKMVVGSLHDGRKKICMGFQHGSQTVQRVNVYRGCVIPHVFFCSCSRLKIIFKFVFVVFFLYPL